MSGVTIQVETPSEEIAPLEIAEAEAEAEAEAMAQAVEVVSDNEVTIAAIEADKEIQIEEIRAEARVAEAEAYAERNNEQWQDTNHLALMVEALTAQVTDLTAQVQALRSLEQAEAETLTALENDLIQSNTADEINSTAMEHIEKSEEESLIPPLVEIEKGPVIRLV